MARFSYEQIKHAIKSGVDAFNRLGKGKLQNKPSSQRLTDYFDTSNPGSL